MAEQFNYSSILAPYMKQLLSIKESAGYNVLRMKWILKEIDDFASLENLTDPHIKEDFFKRWLDTRISDSDCTLYDKHSVWHQLTTLMSRRGCPCYIPKMPRYSKSNFTPYIFTKEQIADIFAAADRYRLYDKRMGTSLIAMPAILRLLYSTGMRVSEAISLRNCDIHLDEHYIHLRKTKNGCERVVSLSESMSAVLSVYISYRNRIPIKGLTEPNNFLFIKADGTLITANSVYNHFKKLLDHCGIPHKGNHHGPRVHDLRHTNAVHALIQMEHAGMDLYTSLPILSTNLGHKSLFATEQYIKLTCAMFPELEEKCSPINAFIYPKMCKAYDNDD